MAQHADTLETGRRCDVPGQNRHRCSPRQGSSSRRTRVAVSWQDRSALLHDGMLGFHQLHRQASHRAPKSPIAVVTPSKQNTGGITSCHYSGEKPYGRWQSARHYLIGTSCAGSATHQRQWKAVKVSVHIELPFRQKQVGVKRQVSSSSPIASACPGFAEWR